MNVICVFHFPTPIRTLLEIVPIQQHDFIKDLFHTTNADIDNDVVTATKWEMLQFFSAWARFLAYYFSSIPTDLQSSEQPHQLDLLVAFPQYGSLGDISK